MKRMVWTLLLLTSAVVLAGCAPTVMISNNTDIDVRVLVYPGMGASLIYLHGGESTSLEASEGSYSVHVFSDESWIAEAKEYRRYLVEQLAEPGNLSGEGIMNVVSELQKITDRINQVQASSGVRCRGRVGSEAGGLVEISASSDGTLAITCN